MPTTRSSTRAQALNGNGTPVTSTNGEKRKLDSETPKTPNQKRARVAKGPSSTREVEAQTSAPQANASINVSSISAGALPLVPAVLTFSFDDAKKHLIGVDRRFEDVFGKMPCKPFEHLERVHPFRALVTSIVGQQISWLAARSVNHRFVKLYDPSLPEKPEDYDAHRTPTSFYPSPEQVATTDMTTLRSCGLSQRKAEYVLDLAKRFTDGRLTTEKLINADDEELVRMLTEVRGIGKWTVDMFAIFSLRRPDILPVGDLGVQRGLVIWFLSLHSPKHKWGFTPKKVPGSSSKKKEMSRLAAPASGDKDELPSFGSTSKVPEPDADGPSPDTSSVPPTTALEDAGDEIPSMPPAFTPSIKKTLYKPGEEEGFIAPPLPAGLTVEVLRSRLDGKKKIKGAFLTPKEMEDLTESWKPYRSLGVYYMWSMANVSE
ncbi:putative DNA glycosylase [Lyophyllum shimeji]|uniref:DNA glycosylase n=1 Tax=Lyophyllum shimeji TaxID=47721 RepID=A0A9P3UL78_LYOSH|nr:putative DNA glycosylase [Lyophyllum shimeji]